MLGNRPGDRGQGPVLRETAKWFQEVGEWGASEREPETHKDICQQVASTCQPAHTHHVSDIVLPVP